MRIDNVTLEMSVKPFRSMDEAFLRSVCREVFVQWQALLRHSEVVSVMLWTADGSEIFDYAGNMDEPLEWARYIGGANPKKPIPSDPEGRALHSRWYLYTDVPPVITYGDLRRIVRLLKEEGRMVTGKPVRVGATFDPGPEFAKSPFKYERHPEICLGRSMGESQHRFVTCYGVLHGDDHAYAGFPDGIPEGTPVGTFFGRQCRHFLEDLDFDYIWFSNGFGFGMETWRTPGAIFDGETFEPDAANEIAAKIVEFWRLFRAECPVHRIETRGTNLTTAVDLATDASPLKSIYAGGFNMAPPPNSPWAALNGDFGLELTGYMSRIAALPDETSGFPFRYYTHDPWWLNSPWLDRYGRESHDIYLPLSVGRIDSAGGVANPTAIEFLTIDDSYGRMPVKVPNEVVPLILEARDDAPDAPGPLVWIYPFDEYHEMTFGDPARLEEVFFGDWFIRGAVNQGLPLNTVVSSANFVATLSQHPELYRESVLISITPDAGTELSDSLIRWVESGGKAILYGPANRADARLLALLNLSVTTPLEGELDLDLRGVPDVLRSGAYPTKMHHRPTMCGGGCAEIATDTTDPHTTVLATVAQGTESRIAALHRAASEWHGGATTWVRGTNSMSCHAQSHLPAPDAPSEWFDGPMLMRFALAQLGCRFIADKHEPSQRPVVVTVARRMNGFSFSGYTPNTTVGLRLRLPQGAPLLIGYETRLIDGHSTYQMSRAWHRECRVFVDRQTDGEVSCVEQHSGEIGIRRRLRISGLQNATVRFYAEPGTEEQVLMLPPSAPLLSGVVGDRSVHADALGHYLESEHVTGELLISW